MSEDQTQLRIENIISDILSALSKHTPISLEEINKVDEFLISWKNSLVENSTEQYVIYNPDTESFSMVDVNDTKSSQEVKATILKGIKEKKE